MRSRTGPEGTPSKRAQKKDGRPLQSGRGCTARRNYRDDPTKRTASTAPPQMLPPGRRERLGGRHNEVSCSPQNWWMDRSVILFPDPGFQGNAAGRSIRAEESLPQSSFAASGIRCPQEQASVRGVSSHHSNLLSSRPRFHLSGTHRPSSGVRLEKNKIPPFFLRIRSPGEISPPGFSL